MVNFKRIIFGFSHVTCWCFLSLLTAQVSGLGSGTGMWSRIPEPSQDIPTVMLGSDNHVSLMGVINSTTSERFIKDLNTLFLPTNPKKNNSDNSDMYVYIDSPGGHVDAGMKIMSEIRKHNISCVADKAYSMAFTIFQSCANRYITTSGRLMQHQMSYGVEGTHLQVVSYVKMMDQINDYLMRLESERIGIPQHEFENLVSNDLWLFSDVAVERNFADQIVELWCTDELIEIKRCPLML